MGPFEAFYESPVQHPMLLWAAALAGGAFCATRARLSPATKRYCLALTALSLADAWLTSRHVYGLGSLSGFARSAVPLFFVLAGDFRYLLLLGLATPAGGMRFDARRVGAAVALTLVVPVSAQLLTGVLAGSPAPPRVLYLIYELAFALLTLAILRWHPGLRRAPWLVAVSRFVLLYYLLWVLSDAIILATGSDLGFLLRVAPNLLYYGGLIAVIGWAASRSESP